MEIGNYNTLEVVKIVDFGLYLDGGDYGNILVPSRYIEGDPQIGDQLSVFIYRDSEDRLIGTSETPLAKVGEFAYLKVTSVNRMGAFLDWGLMKDVLVPFSEQAERMEEGRSYTVYIFLDTSSDRIVASSKTGKFLSDAMPEYKRFEPVQALVEKKTDLGYRCIVDGKYPGLIYHNQIFSNLQVGTLVQAYAERVRNDGKIDLLLEKPGLTKVEEVAQRIMDEIENHKGHLPYGDHSSPDEIRDVFQTSKKTFKKAVGMLLKDRSIQIDEQGIRKV